MSDAAGDILLATATDAAPPQDGTLAEAFARCREVTRKRARNFYHGLRLTPEPRRSALYAIYAWMREADDAADEVGPLEERRQRLANFRETTHAVLRRGPDGAGQPEWLWEALSWTVRSFPIDRSIFDDMLDGLENELLEPATGPLFRTERELSRYCYRVAGTAGLACVWVWGLRTGADAERVRELSLHRGEAFQRTNILRDFRQDFDGDPRRVYLSQESLDRHGLTAEQLRAWDEPRAERCRRFIEEQAAAARSHYDRSAGLEDLIDPACVPTLWAMTRIYSGLLSIIEQDPARVVAEKRIRLSGLRKAAIALRASLGARAARGRAG